MQVWVYALNANYLGGVFIDNTRSTQPQVFVSIWLSWFQLLQKRHVRTMIFLWTNLNSSYQGRVKIKMKLSDITID